MEIIIENRNLELSDIAVDEVHNRSKKMFSRAEHVVTKVSMFLADVNGPKGGVDKQCKVIVNCKSIPPIVVSERRSSLRKAIGSALHRAEFRVKEQTKKYTQKFSKGKRAIHKRLVTQDLLQGSDYSQMVP